MLIKVRVSASAALEGHSAVETIYLPAKEEEAAVARASGGLSTELIREIVRKKVTKPKHKTIETV